MIYAALSNMRRRIIHLCRSLINPSPHEQNGRHFADGIFRGIFMNEKFCIYMKNSLKFVPNMNMNIDGFEYNYFHFI